MVTNGLGIDICCGIAETISTADSAHIGIEFVIAFALSDPATVTYVMGIACSSKIESSDAVRNNMPYPTIGGAASVLKFGIIWPNKPNACPDRLVARQLLFDTEATDVRRIV